MSDDSFQEEIRESFIFYRSFFEALQGFDNETVGECVAALCEYALNGQMKETNNPVVKMFITLTKPQIDANNQRYSNGCKGGAPSGNQNAKKQPKTTENNQKQPTVDFTPQNKTTENNQKQPNENVNVNDNVFFKEKEKEKESSRFSKPTVEEVAKYCRERNNGIDPERFVDFYAAKDWRIGKERMRDWKAAVRTWEKRDEKPRNGTEGGSSNTGGKEESGIEFLNRYWAETHQGMPTV